MVKVNFNYDKKSITLEMAKKMIEAAEKKAIEIGVAALEILK